MYVQDATIDILYLFIFFKTKFMFPIGRKVIDPSITHYNICVVGY